MYNTWTVTIFYSHSYYFLLPWIFVFFLIVTKSISSVSLQYFLTLFLLPLTPCSVQGYIIDTTSTFINTPVADFNQILSPLKASTISYINLFLCQCFLLNIPSISLTKDQWGLFYSKTAFHVTYRNWLYTVI